MSLDDLESYRSRLIASKGTDKDLCRSFLKFVREHHVRESTLITDFCARFADTWSSSLGDELWVVLEQICIAALDVQDLKLADVCIGKLDSKFGNSNRVKRLAALRMEAAGRYSDADIVYQKMLLDDPTNTFAMKRRITLAKEVRDISRAIQLLNEYLAVYMSDTEAWLELSDLYMQQGMFSNAAFCYEELILASPQNFHLYVRYADIRYTMGGVENLEIAKKNYCFALELTPKDSKHSNNRAWFGLALTTHALALQASQGSKKASSVASESKSLVELNGLARKQLSKSYRESGVSSAIREALELSLKDLTVESNSS